MLKEEWMYKAKFLPGILFRLLYPYEYHSLRLYKYDRLLRSWFEDYAWRREETRPPNVAPLIEGAVQPADFVKTTTEILPWEAQWEKWELMYERFKEKQRFLSEELVYQLSLLKVETSIASDRYILQTSYLLLVTLAFTVALLVLSIVSSSSNNPFLILYDDFGVASILLISPTVALFIYGWLTRTFHNERKEIEAKITQITAAYHALDTLDDVYGMRRRLEIKIREEKEERKEEEMVKLDMEERRRRMELEIERDRREMELEFEIKRRDLGLWHDESRR